MSNACLKPNLCTEKGSRSHRPRRRLRGGAHLESADCRCRADCTLSKSLVRLQTDCSRQGAAPCFRSPALQNPAAPLASIRVVTGGIDHSYRADVEGSVARSRWTASRPSRPTSTRPSRRREGSRSSSSTKTPSACSLFRPETVYIECVLTQAKIESRPRSSRSPRLSLTSSRMKSTSPTGSTTPPGMRSLPLRPLTRPARPVRPIHRPEGSAGSNGYRT